MIEIAGACCCPILKNVYAKQASNGFVNGQ